MELQEVMKGLYRITEWIMRLSTVNVLWILCSSPFFYLIAVMWSSPEGGYGQWTFTVTLAAIFAPFTLFPATTATFAVARNWVTRNEEVPFVKNFFRSYKENYKQSMVGGFIFVVLAVILYWNYKFYSSLDNLLGAIALIMPVFFAIYLSMLCYFFSHLVHLSMGIGKIMKNAFVLSLGRPVASLMMLVTNFSLVYLSLKFTFFLPFFLGSTIAITTFLNFYLTYHKIQTKVKLTKNEGDKC
ncbi:DUF624 domain-containing protein [Neobacillus niacini]|uniref:YesL family protein n=1 Tax=Neobacillus niacini TaxID=86668 RepID=UPI0030027343